VSFSVDNYLDRKFNYRTSNCWHLVRDVILELTGNDLGDLTPPVIDSENLSSAFLHNEKKFTKLQSPESPCIVRMLRAGQTPHVGVYYNRRLLHIQRHGVEYLPLDIASRGFTMLEFYSCKM
jgi:hypothetical protein